MILIEIEIRDAGGKKGIGVFTKEFIKKGQTIWEFNELFDRKFSPNHFNEMTRVTQNFLRKYGYVSVDGWWYLDMTNERFINHSSSPNIEFKEGMGGDGYSLRDIEVGEELTCDYRKIERNHLGTWDLLRSKTVYIS